MTSWMACWAALEASASAGATTTSMSVGAVGSTSRSETVVGSDAMASGRVRCGGACGGGESVGVVVRVVREASLGSGEGEDEVAAD